MATSYAEPSAAWVASSRTPLSVLLSLFLLSSFSLSPVVPSPSTLFASAASPNGHVTYAVNCGGSRFVSKTDNVVYEADKGFSSGVTSDAGTSFSPFPRVDSDMEYRTERYDMKSFSYQVPISETGIHTITLKFSEVYFHAPGQKVFNILVGGVPAIRNLDIFALVGRGVPHNEYVEVNRKETMLTVNGKSAVADKWDAKKGMLTIDFGKIDNFDNPKVNAIVINKAPLADVPKLPPHVARKPVTVKPSAIEPDLAAFDVEADDVSAADRLLETVSAPGFEEDDDDVTFDFDESMSARDGSGLRTLLSVTIGGTILLVSLYCMVFAKPTVKTGSKKGMSNKISTSELKRQASSTASEDKREGGGSQGKGSVGHVQGGSTGGSGQASGSKQ